MIFVIEELGFFLGENMLRWCGLINIIRISSKAGIDLFETGIHGQLGGLKLEENPPTWANHKCPSKLIDISLQAICISKLFFDEVMHGPDTLGKEIGDQLPLCQPVELCSLVHLPLGIYKDIPVPMAIGKEGGQVRALEADSSQCHLLWVASCVEITQTAGLILAQTACQVWQHLQDNGSVLPEGAEQDWLPIRGLDNNVLQEVS